MKLYLPHQLFHAVLSCMAAVSFMALASVSSTCYAADEKYVPFWFDGAIYNDDGSYMLTGRGTVSFNGYSSSAIENWGTFILRSNADVTFSGNSSEVGSAIYNEGIFLLSSNADVTFSRNSAEGDAGSIYNEGVFTLSSNTDVNFIGNKASVGSGGAIWNMPGGKFSLDSNRNVIFSRNSAGLGGGAIFTADEDTAFSLSGSENVIFSGNTATIGGAIWNYGSDRFELRANKNVTFSGNTAIYGGAIYSEMVRSFQLSGNDYVVFKDNRARENGGALFGGRICEDDEGIMDVDGSRWGVFGYVDFHCTLSLCENASLTFQNNYAGDQGSAIYTLSNIDILSNAKVLVENNHSNNGLAAAFYTSKNLTIEDNAEVIFRNNGMAFHADTANIGTSIESASTFYLYDSFDAQTLNVNRNSAKGLVALIGENAIGNVSGNASLYSGILALNKNAKLVIGKDLEINSGTLIGLNQGVQLLVSGSLTLNESSYLYFVLDKTQSNGKALVKAENVVLSSAPFRFSWGALGTEPVDDLGIRGYALVEVGSSFIYQNNTYTYNNGVWWNKGKEMDYKAMEEIFPSQNYFSYFWQGNVLWVGDFRRMEERLWVKKGKTWYGEDLSVYNTKKRYLTTQRKDDSDKLKCWVIVAANSIQYWQDQYAPLYQGDKLITELSPTTSANALYQTFDAITSNNGSDGWELAKWWFTRTSKKIAFRANSNKEKEINPWSHLNFKFDQWVNREYSSWFYDNLYGFLKEHLDEKQAPVILGFTQYKNGKKETTHVVTLWGADFTNDADGKLRVTTLYVTDSDQSGGIYPVDLVYKNKNEIFEYIIPGEKWENTLAEITGDILVYYQYTDKNNYMVIDSFSSFTCTDDVDAMMESYNNPKIALQWTGEAKDGKWVTSSTTNSGGAHLAVPEDGWKKACTGGGKTIYAHAYFTQENSSDCKFEFGDSVGGQKVGEKEVILGENLHVGSVQVSGTGYVFSGRQTLTAGTLLVDRGADLRLRDGASIGNKSVVTDIDIQGTLFVEDGGSISNSYIKMSPTGTLWCGSITLADAAESSKNTIRFNNRDYIVTAMDSRLFDCVISSSGTLGCVINMEKGTLRYNSEADGLPQFLYNMLKKGNVLQGSLSAYDYVYTIQNGTLVCTYDALKAQSLALTDSSLTVEDIENVGVTVASYTGAPDLAGSDINLSETSRTEVTASQLVTAPEAAVLLNEQSVLNTKSFIVTANSSFRNEGTLRPLDGKGTVTVEKNATLSGSGTFSSVVSSGTLVVGSSPGAPQYESLTLNTGSTTVFYLDGTTPATSAEKGWGQGLHSVMSVSGDLVMEEGALITLGCSADFLSRCKAGETLSLTLIRSESALSDSLLPILQEQTQFYFAQTDDTLLPSEDYGFTVREHQWSFNEEKSALTLSWRIVSGVKDALVFQGGMDEPVAWVDAWQISEEEPVYYENDTPVAFYQGGHVVLNTTVRPGDMVVSAKEDLTWSGEGGLKGSATLLKEDEGRLVLDISSPNYEGSVIITGGVLETRRADALGAGNVSLYGATLQTPAAHLNSLEMADDVTLLGGGTASNIFLYDETSVHAEDGFTLADSGSLFLAGKADWMGDLTLSDASLVFSAGELSVTGTLTLSGDCELSLGDYAETGRYQLILCDNLSGDWESLAVSQRDDSFIYELVQEEKGLSLVVSSKEPNMYWGFAKGIWREGARFGTDGEGEELLFSAGTHVGFNGKAQVTISGKVFPHAVTVDSAAAVKFTADKKTAGSGIAGAGVLSKNGAGVLTLNAGNTYSGGTVLNAGTIKATAADSFGTGAVTVNGGTLDLASKAVVNNITVNGAAVLKGAAKYAGNELAINGDLLKGTSVTAARTDQRIAIGGECSTITGTVKSAGLVEVNGTLNATAAKLTAAQLKLNSGVFTNTKGIKVAKNQTLTLAGGSLNTGLKVLTVAAGSTLKVEKSATLSGALTLGGGALVLEDGVELSISGTLTLSKATALTLNGTATLTFGTLKSLKKGTLESFFGVGDDVTITQEGNTLVFNSPELTACAVPAAVEPETEAAPALTPAVAPAVAELAKKAAAARPLGDALVMADWGIVDANRAFTNTLQSRRDSGVMLADGQGMAWASAMGGVSRHGSENGHNGADVNMNGAAVGVEHTAGANSVLGLAVGHTWSRIGATGMQHLRQDTAHVALYGQTKLPHGFTAEWSAAYGDTDSKGTFYGTRETWSQKSTAISARLSKSHDLTDATVVRGFAGLNYDATDAASIHGMHTGSIQRLQGEVGAGITHRADKLTTYAEASVTTDLARNTPAVDFGAWRQNGATPGRTGLNLTLGAAYELTDKWSLNAAYHVEAAERATQHSFNVGAGMKF